MAGLAALGPPWRPAPYRRTLHVVEPARKLATYDDLLALAEDVKAEVIQGGLVMLPSALPRHSMAQGTLRSLVGRAFDDDDGRGGPGGWWILLEVDVRLSAHDIAHGVPCYWIVDPEARTLEALRLHESAWVDAGSYDDTATARIPPFEAIELEVGRLFPPAAAPR